MLMRASKHLRQYRHTLKKMKFDPETRTKEQILNDIPPGQFRVDWVDLVESWYSTNNKRLSQYGKVARASQSHMHTTGCTSYANKRADFVETMGRQPSHLEFYKLTHTKLDGGFVGNTVSSEFLEEANAKVQELVENASSSGSRIEIENDVFDSLMYEEEQPKRPVGFGFGVKQSAIFGVHNLLRKKGHDSTIGTNITTEMESLKATIINMKKENQSTLANIQENQETLENMKKENQGLQARLDQSNQIMIQAINAMRTGTVSHEFWDAAQSTLRAANSQAASASSGYNTHSDDFLNKNHSRMHS